MYNRNQYSGAYSRRRYSNMSAAASSNTSTATGQFGSGSAKPQYHVNTSANDRSMGDVKIQVISEPTGQITKEENYGDKPPMSRYTPLNGLVFPKGTILLVQANPYSGYRFVSWQSAAYIPSSAHQQRSFKVTVKSDMTFIANFVKMPSGYSTSHTLSVNWDHTMGRVNANGLQEDGQMAVPYGSQVTLTAVPKDGYVFRRWSGIQLVGNVQSNESKTITITMPNSNLSLTAEFAKVVDNPGGGGGTPSGDINDEPDTHVIGGGGGGVYVDETETVAEVATEGSLIDKAIPFVKKWWWAIAIVAYVVWKERKGGSK